MIETKGRQNHFRETVNGQNNEDRSSALPQNPVPKKFPQWRSQSALPTDNSGSEPCNVVGSFSGRSKRMELVRRFEET
jgi:hypothetical protein